MSTPYKSAKISSSTKSIRRSPLSHLDKKDCAFPSLRDASAWVMPASRLASRRRAKKPRYLSRYSCCSSK